jgi:uncharacterized protein
LLDLILSEYPLILSLLATGIIAGFLAGLLGVGGGIIIVPVLFTVLGIADVDIAIRLQLAIGTSLATIIPTSIASLRAHNKKDAVDWALLRSWAPFLVIGVAIGTWIATTQIDGAGLALVFAVIAIAVAIDLVVRDRTASDAPAPELNVKPWLYSVQGAWAPAVIGACSAMMGIGGGTLSVPFLNALKYPIHKAVATSAGFGLIIAVPATLGFVVGGWTVPDRPVASLGYVNIFGFLAISLMTVCAAPIGSRIAHAVKPRTLRLLFSGFLGITAVRMFIAFS